MSRYWTSFASSSNPNSGGSNWPSYTSDSDEVMVLATTNGDVIPGPMAHLKSGQCDFWDANPIPTALVFGDTIYN
jgi:carboxylesterase type B